MSLDPLWLSRLQWAWVMAWHILLPAFTVGLASYIAVLEAGFLFTRREVWLRMSRFWLKIFAVSFTMGVVSGVVMPFQLGTNWSRFTDTTADVLSPLFAYEGLTAFFLESTFLAVLLFGRKLVPPWAHFGAAVLVAVGTLLSSFWILAANSWMQTPQGYELVNGKFEPTDWLAIVFNPSFPYRFAHNVTAFYITTAFVVLGVGAYLLRRRKDSEAARKMMQMALNLLIVLVPLQFALGDLHGLNTLRYQPAKIAAIEGLYESAKPAPLMLFGIPDDRQAAMRYAITIPALGSLILTHSWTGEVRGLSTWPKDMRPPVGPPFFAFRVMVAIGIAMLLLVGVAQVMRRGDRLFRSEVLLRLCQWAAPLGFIAVLAGWTTTEVGRQPWTVYGLVRTADSVSPSLSGADVAFSLALYVVVYLIMFPAGLAVMLGSIRRGPQSDVTPAAIAAGGPKAPLAGDDSRRPKPPGG
jgi:cytochrome d ubiquinol oxidase subunit I